MVKLIWAAYNIWGTNNYTALWHSVFCAQWCILVLVFCGLGLQVQNQCAGEVNRQSYHRDNKIVLVYPAVEFWSLSFLWWTYESFRSTFTLGGGGEVEKKKKKIILVLNILLPRWFFLPFLALVQKKVVVVVLPFCFRKILIMSLCHFL